MNDQVAPLLPKLMRMIGFSMEKHPLDWFKYYEVLDAPIGDGWQRCPDVDEFWDALAEDRLIRPVAKRVSVEIEMPAPIKLHPDIDELYWFVGGLYEDDEVCHDLWVGSAIDFERVELGLAFDTEAEARAAFYAIRRGFKTTMKTVSGE